MDGVVRYPIDGLERFINKNLHHNARANNNAGGRVSNYKKIRGNRNEASSKSITKYFI